MPNHYTTIAICSPGHEFDAERFNAECAKINLCEAVKPMPSCLKGVVSSSPERYQYRHKATGEVWREDCNGPKSNHDDWEQVPLSEHEVTALTHSVGAADWYDWNRANWGTKWGTYGLMAFELGGDGSPVAIKFQSAWGPPKILDDIAAWLMDRWGFERVAWIGFDPYDDSTEILGTTARKEEANEQA